MAKATVTKQSVEKKLVVEEDVYTLTLTREEAIAVLSLSPARSASVPKTRIWTSRQAESSTPLRKRASFPTATPCESISIRRSGPA